MIINIIPPINLYSSGTDINARASVVKEESKAIIKKYF